MPSTIKDTMHSIFEKVQHNKTNHSQYIHQLKNIYNKTDLNTFWKNFVWHLKFPLASSSDHSNVTNTLEFCAKFCIYFHSSSENETTETMSPFLEKLFRFLLTNNNAKDKRVRFHICQFLNMLLNSMGDNAFIEDDLCDKITISMMDRLMDKSPKVRAQAIFALYRLQDPSNEQCPVIKMYIFHVSKDPSAEVRKAVLTTMAKNQKTLQAALLRTRDIDDSVRKKAYEFISKITVRSLTIEQRECLLKNGLKDRSENVRACVNKVLLPAWLRYYKGEYMDFIHALDIGMGTETASSALEILFKNNDLNILLEQVPVDKNTKLIPLTNLTNENVLYWKCIIQHLHRLSCIEEIESIIPELSEFCKYIRDFLAFVSSQKYEAWEQESHKFILLQLSEISTTYDLSDEVGRKNLNELIKDILMSDYCSIKIIKCLVNHLETVIPNTDNMLKSIVNIISEIMLPLKENLFTPQIIAMQQEGHDAQKNKLKTQKLELEEELYKAIKEHKLEQVDILREKIDSLKKKIDHLYKVPEAKTTDDNTQKEENNAPIIVKCLEILFVAMQSVCELTPVLKSLMPIVLNSFNHVHSNVRTSALKTLCVYCILDQDLAKMHLTIFFYQFSLEQDTPEIWITSLKAIFDILLLYGLEHFDILQLSQENTQEKNTSEKTRSLYTHDENDSLTSTTIETEKEPCNYIKILIELLNNKNQDLRTIAVEGFCKLLLNQRIKSDYLISLLIIMSYNPVNVDDDSIRQCLSVFFDSFVTRVSDAHEMLERAYLQTLRILYNAPDVSPLTEINAYHISKFILNLIRQACQKTNGQSIYTQNNLAFAMLAEILHQGSKIDPKILIKSLIYLHIQIEDDVSKENLQKAIKRIKKKVIKRDKKLLKYVLQFQKHLEMPSEEMEISLESDSSNE